MGQSQPQQNFNSIATVINRESDNTEENTENNNQNPEPLINNQPNNTENFQIDNNFNSIQKEYFQSLKLILRDNYLQNDNRLDNMKTCLNEKNFEQIINNPVNLSGNLDFEENEPIEFIYWLDYLYEYLLGERRKNRYWADEMLVKLDKEYFVTENKYLSQFFYEEYGMMTEPECIKKINLSEIKRKINEEEFLYNENNKEDNRISISNQSLSVTKNLGGSFTSTNSNEEEDNLDENDAEFKYKMFRSKVKKYIFIFKEHIIYKDHPINIVMNIFESCWVKYVEEKIKLLKNNITNENDTTINLIVNELTRQLQKFVIKLQICLKLFYCRTINYSCFNEEKDELINLLSTLIFRTGNIYNVVFELYEFQLNPIIKNMTSKYQSLKNITPEQLGVSTQFCLNKEALLMQENILNEALKKKEKDTKDIESGIKDGILEMDLTEKIMDQRKITSLLKNIQFMKKKYEYLAKHKKKKQDIEVNIDFSSNEELLLTSYPKQQDNLIENDVIGSIFSSNFSDENFVKTGRKSKKNKNNIMTELGRQTTNVYKFHKLNKIDEEIENTSNNNIDNNQIFTNKKSTNLSAEFTGNNYIIRDLREERKSISPFNPIKVFNRISYQRNDDLNDLSYPYETAIQLLKQIKKYKAPFEKMLIIASLSDEIVNCINDFWKDMNEYINNDLLNIEAEQIMTIFIYIILKAEITDIIVHCKMIQLFTTCTTKASMIGYYYSTAEASVTFIKSLKNVEELLKCKGTNKVFDYHEDDNNVIKTNSENDENKIDINVNVDEKKDKVINKDDDIKNE